MDPTVMGLMLWLHSCYDIKLINSIVGTRVSNFGTEIPKFRWFRLGAKKALLPKIV
jgi:hypothetical protein